MTTSWQAVEVPAQPKLIDPIKAEIKAEPAAPVLPAPGGYGASNLRAELLGLYALALRKWGRGLITASDIRDAAALAVFERQQTERAAALARLDELQAGED